MQDVIWLDEVPLGVEGLAALSPKDIDAHWDQARLWATIREAVVQAYAEGFTDGLKSKTVDLVVYDKETKSYV